MAADTEALEEEMSVSKGVSADKELALRSLLAPYNKWLFAGINRSIPLHMMAALDIIEVVGIAPMAIIVASYDF